MKLHVNGEQRDFKDAPTPFTLAALVETLGMKADRVAVELNRDIVPRDRWAETTLNEGDRLEVVHFVGGGSYQGTAISGAVKESAEKRICFGAKYGMPKGHALIRN